MEFYEDNEGESSGTDLLASNPSTLGSIQRPRRQRPVGVGDVSRLISRRPQVQNQQQEQATPSFTSNVADDGRRTPTGPPASSLFDKLGQLEKRWTDKPSGMKRASPRPASLTRPNESSSARATGSPYGMASLGDSVSPITLFGESPIVASADDQSVSTYGSLGSPGSFFVPSLPEPEQSKKKPSTKDSFFDRLHRGEKRTTNPRRPLTTKPKSTQKPPSSDFTPQTPTQAARPTTSATTTKKKPSFLKSLMKRKTQVAPMPQTPNPASQTSNPASQTRILPSQTPTTAVRRSTQVTQQKGKSSVFERLYRKERRKQSVWTDPGAKRGRHFQFVKSGKKTNLIEASGGAAKKSVQRKLTFSGDDDERIAPYDGAMLGKLTTAIQTGWRYHQAQRTLIEQLVENYAVNSWPADRETVTQNRILRIKFELLARMSAIRQADLNHLQKRIRETNNTLLLDSVTDVCFEAWDKDLVVQLKYTVSVQCQVKMIQLLQSWSPEKLGYTLHRWALERSYEEHTDKLSCESAARLQQWCFAMTFQNRKRAARSPTPSVASESSLKRQIETYESLSWFHERLRKEAVSAKLARFQIAAVVIQSSIRGHLARKQAQALWEEKDVQPTDKAVEIAAVVIQKSLRRYLAQQQLQAMWDTQDERLMEQAARFEAAAVLIQSSIRTYLAQKHSQFLREAQLEEGAVMWAAVVIQRSIRRYLAQEQLQAMLNAQDQKFVGEAARFEVAAVLIQSSIRTYLAQKHSQFLREAQYQTLEEEAARLGYVTVIIQTSLRRYLAQKRWQALRIAAVLIQSSIRRCFAQGQFLRTVAATIRIQSVWRTALASMQARSLQFACEQQCQNDCEAAAAISIQASFRKHRAMASYYQLKRKTIQIQTFQRRRIQQLRHRRRIRVQAVIIIQSYFRKHRALASYDELRRKTIHLQAFQRMRMHRARLRLRRQCTLRIQTVWRLVRVRSVQGSPLQLQSKTETQATKVPKQYEQVLRERSASTIKRAYVAFKHRQLTSAVSVLQRCWRAYESRSSYLQLSISARRIQKFARQIVLVRRFAASVIQSHRRGFKDREAYLRIKGAVSVIQNWYRANVVRQTALEAQWTIMTIRIQSLWRGFQARSNRRQPHAAQIRAGFILAATTIQSHYRAFRPRQAFLTLRKASVKIQALGRKYIVRQELWLIEQMVIQIQCLIRGFAVRRRIAYQEAALERQLMKEFNATLVIQRQYRAYPRRHAFWRLRAATFMVQAFIRGSLARKMGRRKTMAAIVMGRAWRRYRKRCLSLAKLKGKLALSLTAIGRGYLARKRYAEAIQIHELEAIKALQNAAKLAQTHVRGWLCRKPFLTLRVRTIAIQAFYRGRIQRRGFIKTCRGISLLQALHRRRSCRANLLSSMESIVKVQTAWRDFRRRRLYEEQQLAKRIQNYCQTYLQRVSFLRLRNAAILIQSAVRRHLAVQMRESWLQAAVRIQLIYSKKKQNLPQYKRRTSALVVQRNIRAWICKRNRTTLSLARKMLPKQTQQKFSSKVSGRVWGKRVRALLQDRLEMAVVIQSWWRTEKERSNYQHKRGSIAVLQFWTRIQVLPRVRLRSSAATRIQAFWRSAVAQENFALLLATGTLISQQTREKMASRLRGPLWGRRVQRLLFARAKQALRIQNAWLVHKARSVLNERKEALILLRLRAAILLQSHVRGCLCRKSTQPLIRTRREACTKVQGWWRMQQTRKSFKKKYRALLVIQAMGKRQILRSRKAQQVASAILFQRRLRMNSQRRHFQVQRLSVILIQQQLRSGLLQKARKRTLGATTIATWWRRSLAQRNYHRLLACCAVLSSSTVRNMTARIQGPAWGLGVQVKRKIQIRAASAVVIQSLWRCHVHRAFYEQLAYSTAIIQKTFRMHLCRSKFLQQRVSAEQIQAVVRGWIAQTRLSTSQFAASVVQKNIRMWIVLCRMRTIQYAAVVIQKHVRGWIVTSQMSTSHYSAVVIQKQWRAQLSLSAYRRKQNAATRLQTVWQVWNCTGHYRKVRAAAIAIQATFRMFSKNKEFNEWKSSALTLQRAWKQHLGHLDKMRRTREMATGKIQALVRSWIAQNQLRTSRYAAMVVQKKWRSHLCQSVYRRSLQACRTIQLFTRSSVFGRILKRKAATRLQTAWRGLVCSRRYSHSRIAAIAIQSAFRMHSKRKSMIQWKRYAKQLKNAQECAAAKIQSLVRSWIAQNELRTSRYAALLVQKQWRVHLFKSAYRRSLQACRTIQLFARSFVLGRSLKRNAATILQTAWRKFVCSRPFLCQRIAAITIQSNFRIAWRRHLMGQVEQSAAVRIQAYYRGWILREHLIQMALADALFVSAALTIQGAWRNSRARRRQETAAAKIQALVRKWIAQTRLTTVGYAAVLIQKQWRAHYGQSSYISSQGASRAIQAFTRRFVIGRSVKRDAALVLQTAWRVFQASLHYNVLKRSSITVQSSFRMHVQRRRFMQLRSSTNAVQNAWRRHMMNQKQELAACKIQAHIRGWQFREQLIHLALADAALVLQRTWRRVLAFKIVDGVRQGALEVATRRIQAAWRKKLCHNSYHQAKNGVVVIQSWWRTVSATIAFKRQQASCMKIQSLARRQSAATLISTLKVARDAQLMDLSATVIQSWRRTVSATIAFKRQQASCIKIQSLARRQSAAKLINTLKVARDAQLMNSSATVIQSWWRCVSATGLLNEQRLACVKIQSLARRHLCQLKHRALRVFVHLIQSTIRQHLTYKKFRRMRRAACKIQAIVRMHLQRKGLFSFVERRGNTELELQRAWRGSRLQSFAKRALARRAEAQRLRQSGAAILLQGVWRRLMYRDLYERKRQACFVIQAFLRQQRHTRQQRRQACVAIQAIVRQRQHYRRYKVKIESAVLIQSCSRMIQCREHYIMHRVASTLIGSIYRCYADQERYSRLRESAVTLQKWARRTLSRQILKSRQRAKVAMDAAACRVQSAYRMHCTRRAFCAISSAAVKIQRIYLARRSIQLASSATYLQAHVRMHLTRRKLQHSKLAASIIQAFARMILARKNCDRLRQHLALEMHRHDTASRLQAFVRGSQLRKALRHKVNAAKLIQACFRRNQCQDYYTQLRTASSMIASAYRGARSRSHHRKLVAAVVRAQSIWRMHIMNDRYSTKRRAAESIQKWYRYQSEHIASVAACVIQKFWLRQLRIRKAVRHQAAGRIQGLFRQRKRRLAAVVSIQKLWRRHVISSQLSGQRLHDVTSLVKSLEASVREDLHCWLKDCAFLGLGIPLVASDLVQKNKVMQSVVKLQLWTRLKLAERRYQRENDAARIIQARFITWKANLSLLAVESSAVLMKRSHNGLLPSSATFFAIQQVNRELSSSLLTRCPWFSSDIRWIKARVTCEHYASIRLQRAMRKQIIMKRAMEFWNSLPSHERASRTAIVSTDIDDEFTSWLRMLQVKQGMAEQQNAAIRIQKVVRSKKVPLWKTVVFEVVRLQSLVRGHSARQSKQRRKNAVLFLQRKLPMLVSEYIERKRLRAAMKLQCLFRAWLHRRNHLLECNRVQAAIEIQSHVRRWLGRRRYLGIRRERNRTQAAVKLQSVARVWLWKRKYLDNLRERRRREACVKLQSLVRAWLSKREYRDKLHRRRMIQATERGFMLRSELERFLLDRLYEKIQRAARIEVDHLLEQNHDMVSSGICLKRLAARVVLGRLRADEEKNQRDEAVRVLELERKLLRELGGQTFVLPEGKRIDHAVC